MGNTSIIKQKDLLHKREWDFLIILDACRYDYFERIHGDYLEGDLKKVLSLGSGTGEWLLETFDSGPYENIIYVSGTPHVNSRGIEVIRTFDGSKKFGHVVDAWDEGYDEDKGAIMPQTVRNMALDKIQEFPGKRFIIHFNQPHQPFLSMEDTDGKSGSVYVARGGGEIGKSFFERFSSLFEKSLDLMFGIENTFGLKGFLNLTKEREPEEKKKIRRYYRENLEIVLEEVEKLIHHLNGRIVISADHGELLGEYGQYGHPALINHPILREVPWFEIEKLSKN